MSRDLIGRVLMVHQDYAHHVQSEPIEQLGQHVIFPWPIDLPDGFDRVSTPLLTPQRLAELRFHTEACACEDAVWPEPTPRPIPEPEPEPDPEEWS